jgi:hypothetical protein
MNKDVTYWFLKFQVEDGSDKDCVMVCNMLYAMQSQETKIEILETAIGLLEELLIKEKHELNR